MKQLFGKCISASIATLCTTFYAYFFLLAIDLKEWFCAVVFLVLGLFGFFAFRFLHEEIEEYGI
jgi:hypothetical protein